MTKKKPAKLTRYTIEPSHDAWSTVTGPLGKGVSVDRNTGKAGDSHPSPQPAQIVAILALMENHKVIIINRSKVYLKL